MLLLRARVDLGAMPIKGHSAFPKAPVLMEPHHQISYYYIEDNRWGRVLPTSRRAVGVFYNPSRRGKKLTSKKKTARKLFVLNKNT